VKTYSGINALSVSKAQGLLKRLQHVDKNVRSVSAEFVHFIDTDATLSAADDAKLQQLLTYDTPFSGNRTGSVYLVVPRPGTISPWSSKATDIAHNAGLTHIQRIERGLAYYIDSVEREKIAPLLHDRMTETVLSSLEAAETLFGEPEPKPLIIIDVLKGGKTALEKANSEQGLALSADEIDYLVDAYTQLGRNPSDAELMMFGQVNSEHCRHKVFNADWVVDGRKQPKSLFKMIRNTYELGGEGVLSAYSDNAAVLAGPTAGRFFPDPETHEYGYTPEPIHTVIKVETHNHPTAIAPFPGAATGTGGEIRDEGATGRGAKPKMGLAGFSVSNLHLPDAPQPWEKPYGKPDRITSPLGIMLDAPLGGAAFANEFGRPNLAGYFRTYEQHDGHEVRGYHKPIMIAGGLGNIRDKHVQKGKLRPGDKIIILGGPAMLIGLGGGAASSMQTGASSADLDFASVQRGNGEMERRAQEVIDACWASGEQNPIVMIHDIGAGGYCNAVPELVHDAGLGARVELRDIANADPGMSPMEIWCNEAQERYVIGLRSKDADRFAAMCERERCPYTVIGTAVDEDRLVVHDRLLGNNTVDLPMTTLFGKPPKMTREFSRTANKPTSFDASSIDIAGAVQRVLHMPSVGSKKFLITIGDRSITGLVARDQMIGPWQVPVSDVAVTAAAFDTTTGEAMAMGERAPLAVTNAPASGRMAIAETITNMLAADIKKLSDIKLSANWMAAVGHERGDEELYNTVHAVGEDFCPALGLTIPVGKDSLSMRSTWSENSEAKSVASPLSLIITGFSPVGDVTKTLTPQLDVGQDSVLMFVDLSGGHARLGGSALAQAYGKTGGETPDADSEVLKKFFAAFVKLKEQGKILAYHDRSDGGLFTTLCEMAFASRCGLDIDLASLSSSVILSEAEGAVERSPKKQQEDSSTSLGMTVNKHLAKLFSEELGAVIQVKATDEKTVSQAFSGSCSVLGKPTKEQRVTFRNGKTVLYQNSRAQLEQWWAETSYHIQKLRDNPECAEQEYAAILDDADPGLSPRVESRDMSHESRAATKSQARSNEVTPVAEPLRSGGASEQRAGEWRLDSSKAMSPPQEGRAPLSQTKKEQPRVAIFREQGVNGQIEMAAAFDRAGFTSVDVHLNDIIQGNVTLADFSGLVACGGFSYGLSLAPAASISSAWCTISLRWLSCSMTTAGSKRPCSALLSLSSN
jgi:phosphoribosylformylglycinamidine synthase